MMPEQDQRPVYASAGWEIDLARRELRSLGVPVPLGGRAFEIVAELVQSDGELVTKADLTARIWPRTFVEEGALRVHIAAIRKAFGSDRDIQPLAAAIGCAETGGFGCRAHPPNRLRSSRCGRGPSPFRRIFPLRGST
jgi:DNA-binding response OmpR family regulator